MKSSRRFIMLLALLAGGIPLATFATCDRTTPYGGAFHLVSSNDDLVADVLDIVFGEDDD